MTNTSAAVSNDDLLYLGEHVIQINTAGFLLNFNDWNEEVAERLAVIDKLELKRIHWVILRFLRQYFTEYATPPSPKLVKKMVSRQMGIPGFSNKQILQIFPLGGCRQACRLAGLPRHFSYAC